MKLRYAAALALVGWYFMLLPLQFVGPGNDPYGLAIVDDAAPCLVAAYDDLQDPTGMRQLLDTSCEKHAQERQNRAGQKGCRDAHRDLARQVSVCRNRRSAPQGKIARRFPCALTPATRRRSITAWPPRFSCSLAGTPHRAPSAAGAG